MAAEIDTFDEIILRDYLAENWENFVSFCDERGVNAEDIYTALGGNEDN